jgi:hypothetical protein
MYFQKTETAGESGQTAEKKPAAAREKDSVCLYENNT